MTQALSAVFKIRPGEGIIVLQFAVLFLLIQAGSAIGITTSDSLFLLTVGSENLPKVYVLVPVVMLLYIPFSSYLTTRFDLGRVFLITLFGLVAGGVIFWALLGSIEGSAWRKIVLYGAKIYSAVTFIALYSLSWNFTYQYFNILDGKRLFAFFTGGSAVGAILGGILINLLTGFIPVSGLYLVWSGLILCAIPVFRSICATHRIIESESIGEVENLTIVEQTVRLGSIIRRSRYVLILLAVLFFAQVLTTLNEFQYLDIFSTEYQNEAELASLFGKLYIGVNVFNLLVSMFIFNRMVLRFGVRNVALILPIVYTLVFSWFFLDYGLMAGFVGFFAYQGLMVSVDYDNTNLLLNALPSEAKAQVRTFIEGLAEPLATAAAGLFLLSFGAGLDREIISLIGIVGALIYFLLVLVLRHSYVGAMITNLKKSWLDFSRNADEVVSELEEEELAFVEAQARSRNPEKSPTAIGILWLNDQASAADALLDFMSHVKPEHREKAEPLFARLLKQEDTGLFRRILEWLDKDQARIDTDLIQEISISGLPRNKYLSRLMKSPGPHERATAGLQLLKSWKLDDRAKGLEMFEELFDRGDGGVAAAIQAIGRTGDERYAHFVAPYLNDSDTKVQEESLLAVNRLVTHESGRLLPMILDVIRDQNTDKRLKAMDALIRIGDAKSISPLLMLAGSFTSMERRKAEAVVESVGLQGVPIAVSVLRSRKFPFRGRAIAARALGKLAFPQFEDTYPGLIPPELEMAFRSLYRYEMLSEIEDEMPGVDVLRRLFLDARMRVVEFVLELLSIGGRLPDFELISASLRSNNPKERGNAIETIEQGISQELFRTLLPLIDSRPLKDRIRFYVDHFEPAELTPNDIILDSLNSNFPIGSMVAAQALWELNAAGNIGPLRDRLRQSDSPDFRSVVLSLMGVESGGLNLVERIHHLMRSSLFESFGVIAMEMIAKNAEEARFIKGEPIYRKGDPADALFYVIEGKVRHEERINGFVEPGEVFGEECLFGEDRTVDAISETAYTLKISKEAVFKNVDVYPETALYLLEFSKQLAS